MPKSTSAPAPRFNRFPADLTARPQWVCWRLEERQGKPTKIPFDPVTGKPASSTDPATWRCFADAVAAYGRGGYNGVGYVFSGDDPFAGIDLDHVRDQSGTFEPWARDMVKRLDSYTELSQSGAGVHIIIRAKLPGGRRRKGAVEMYDAGRYFCMTGLTLAGMPGTVEDRQAVLDAVHKEIFGEGDAARETEATPPAATPAPPSPSLSLTDTALIEKAKAAKNGGDFAALWRGDWKGAGYGSQSDADAALLGMLRFWTGGDKARAFALFSQSGLSREKWTSREDYRERTWAAVSDGDTYTPPAPVTLGKSATAAETATGHTSASPSWPAAPDAACYYGLAGEIVRTIEPHTEADPLALLSQLLVFFGSCTGRAPHFTAEADRHGMNEFLLLIGETSKGRKGTSAGHVRRLFEAVDPTWARERIQSGLSSGEGLVWAVRDPIEKVDKDGETCLVDPGEPDKRLLAMESEFAGTLHNIERQGNTLSAAIRNLWDSGTVRNLTKNSPAKTTDAHVSIVGHITRDELLRYMSRTELANGFANRFLFVAVRRSKMLPEGGNLEEGAMYPLTERLRDAVSFARTVAEMRRDEEARALWHAVYPRLSEGKRGLLGGILSRAEAHTMRLAGLYALLDQSATIRRDHLTAALAFWEYVEESAAWIFGDSLGDPEADTILRQLRLRPEGLTRTEINNLFGRHLKADQIERALVLLLDRRLAECLKAETAGRHTEVFRSL